MLLLALLLAATTTSVCTALLSHPGWPRSPSAGAGSSSQQFSRLNAKGVRWVEEDWDKWGDFDDEVEELEGDSALAAPLSGDRGLETLTLLASEEDAGQRLDALLCKKCAELSRSRTYFQNLMSEGLVQVDGRPARKSHRAEAGQKIEVKIIASEPILTVEAQNIPLDIIYEDEHMLAVSKPAGMVVHPAPGNWDGTFANALMYHLRERGVVVDSIFDESLRPFVVHRLDKGTTGVLLGAKSAAVQAKLAALFAERKVHKTYIAVCIGNPGLDKRVDVPIGRHPTNRQKMLAVPTERVDVRTRSAISNVDAVAFDGKLSVAKVGIETGRTHQIRVHLQHLRTPVVGDDLYGNREWNRSLLRKYGIDRPLLHAWRLVLPHPITGETLDIQAPLPEDTAGVVSSIYPEVYADHPDWMSGVDEHDLGVLEVADGQATAVSHDAEPAAFDDIDWYG